MNPSSTNQNQNNQNQSNQNQNGQNQNNQSKNQSQNQNQNQGKNQRNKNPDNQINQVQAVQGQMGQSDRRFWTIVSASIVVIAIIAWGVYHNDANAPSQTPADTMESMISTSTDTDMADATTSAVISDDETYTYSCDNGKNMSATFHLPKDDFVNVNLSDSRHFILAHAISADGARYANANESIVFWTRGVTAFVQENGTTTYSGCIANRFP